MSERDPAEKSIHVFGRNASGGHNVGIDACGLRVLVESRDESTDESAVQLAQRIDAMARGVGVSIFQKAVYEREISDLRETVARMERQFVKARATLDAAVTGRRRFFGPVLLSPGSEGWHGDVWLLDPTKEDAGMGIRFESLAALREEHPELWIVDTHPRGVILDALPLPGAQDRASEEIRRRAIANGMPLSGRFA